MGIGYFSHNKKMKKDKKKTYKILQDKGLCITAGCGQKRTHSVKSCDYHLLSERLKTLERTVNRILKCL